MSKCHVIVKVGENTIEEVITVASVPTTHDEARIVLLAACTKEMKLALQLDNIGFNPDNSFLHVSTAAPFVLKHTTLCFATKDNKKVFVLFIED